MVDKPSPDEDTSPDAGTYTGELGLVLCAVMFYSRLRVPKGTPFSDEALNRSRKYFPAVGLLVGLIGAGVYGLIEAASTVPLAIALSMVATVGATGAFHEDGLADTCDGLGGGLTLEHKLAIMKDSRLGTYGTIGLIAALGTKFAALHSVAMAQPSAVVAVLVFGHVLSRQLASRVVDVSTYVQDLDSSKMKPIASRRLSTAGQVVAWSTVAVAAVPLAIVAPLGLVAVVPACAVAVWFGRRVERSIGGYTGDTLGATQQLSELVFYIGVGLVLVNWL